MGPQQHHALMGQARQRAADDGAADAEYLAERLFAELGPRRQTLLEDGIEDVRINDIVLRPGASLAGLGRLLQGLQLFVHRSLAYEVSETPTFPGSHGRAWCRDSVCTYGEH